MFANRFSYRTITAAAVVLSGLGYGGIISLYPYVFVPQYVFTVKMVPQIWRCVTAFLVTKPKFGILLDPYFLYQYGSGLERESSRFTQPGDFFVYTLFVGSVIIVSVLSALLEVVHLNRGLIALTPLSAISAMISISSPRLSARPAYV